MSCQEWPMTISYSLASTHSDVVWVGGVAQVSSGARPGHPHPARTA